VRRDNVEHLVMIGGPNDILIESQIVRAEARDMPRQRDKEPTVAPLNWPAGNAPALSPSVAGEPRLLPEDSAAAAQDMTPETAPSLGRAPAAPVKAPVAVTPPSARPPFLPLPPRRPITTPSFSFKPGPRPAGDPAPGSSAENGQALPTPVVSTLPPLKTPAAPPARAPRPQPQTAGPLPPSPLANPLAPNPLASPPLASPLAPPVTPARPVENEPSVAPVIVSPQELPPESPPKTIDPIESLEEEMAKLLGRDPKEL
jgi:hypothetical protein